MRSKGELGNVEQGPPRSGDATVESEAGAWPRSLASLPLVDPPSGVPRPTLQRALLLLAQKKEVKEKGILLRRPSGGRRDSVAKPSAGVAAKCPDKQ